MSSVADKQKCKEGCEKFLKEVNLPAKLENLVGRKFSFYYGVDLAVTYIEEVISGTILGVKVTLDDMFNPYLLELFVSVPQSLSPADYYSSDSLKYTNDKGWQLSLYRQERQKGFFYVAKTKIIEYPGIFELH